MNEYFTEKEVSFMPGFDGTGPAGGGPMTGWGRGSCDPSRAAYGPAVPSRSGNWGVGRFFGWARGFARGYGRGFGRGRGFGGGFGRRGGYR